MNDVFLKAHYRRKDEKNRAKWAKRSAIGERLEFEIEGERLTTLHYPGNGGLIVTVHGGGFASNCVFDEDNYCAYLRKKTGKNVISLDYTLTYKKRYPVQLEECDAQIKNFLNLYPEVAAEKIVLIGHSAGGNLAAALAIKALREKAYTVGALILNYPGLDLMTQPKDRPRYLFTLTDRTLKAFQELYCSDEMLLKNPLVSPIFLSAEDLKAFPPTCLVEAKNDKLAIDAVKFFRLLTQNGVAAVKFKAAAIHGFIEVKMRACNRKRLSRSVRYAIEVTDTCLNWLKSAIE